MVIFPAFQLPRTYSEVTKLSKRDLDSLCRKFKVRVNQGLKAKVNLLSLQLGISTAGPIKEDVRPREVDSGLTSAQQHELSQLTPGRVDARAGWTKHLTQCPNIDEAQVKQYLLDSKLISTKSARTYKLTRPFELKDNVHSINFHSLLDSNTYCLIRGHCIGG